MAIHIMDGEIFKSAYIVPEIREIFDEKSVVESWLIFEGILAEVQGELGIIPLEVAKEIKAKASLKHVEFERIVEINSKVKLASVATIRALAEVCEKDAGEYIHYGSCSPELFENSLAYRIRKTMDIFERELHEIRSILFSLADTHKHTIMVDRSHGQQGNPTTFGFVAAIWSGAITKHIERFQEARKRILIGSLKGAFGNYASYYAIAGEKCLEMEKQVLKRLGLYPNRISIRRHMERFAEFLNLLSLLSITFEKIFDDIFCQQRNEIAELEEPFDSENQIGSSTLPHKRNPVLSEAIIAWSKKIRSNASAFSETHMRDSHDIIGFYMEDLIIPETCILTGSMLNSAKYILGNLKVKKDAMQKNLELSNGLVMAESLMLALSKKTKKKQTAHHIFHKIAMESFEKGIPFDKCILEDPDIHDHLTTEEIKNLINPKNYLGLNDKCIENIIRS
ncbi:Adenylosuccinate lyase [subsurface metagenome]